MIDVAALRSQRDQAVARAQQAEAKVADRDRQLVDAHRQISDLQEQVLSLQPLPRTPAPWVKWVDDDWPIQKVVG